MTWEALLAFLTTGWDVAKVIGVMAGLVTIFGGGWGLYWRITTAESRRLRMLHNFAETREAAISDKRKDILDGIRLSEHFQLEQKPLDVGAEIDEVMKLLDKDRLKQATEALVDLEERLERKEKIVRRFADELLKHKASVHVFIAALADRRKRVDQGLEHVGSALAIDKQDKDALKCQGWLLLKKNDRPGAEESFKSLRRLCTAPENRQHRCDALEGLGFTYRSFGPERYTDAEAAFNEALEIIRQLAGNHKDGFTRGRIHDVLGDMYADALWSNHRIDKAIESYGRALDAFKGQGKSEKETTARARAAQGVKKKQDQLQKGIEQELLQ